MCIGFLANGKPCRKTVRKDGACSRHYVNKDQLKTHPGKTRKCVGDDHKFSASPYHSDFVPVENFFKAAKSETNLYRDCCHCREMSRKKRKDLKEKRLSDSNRDGFQMCSWASHEKINGFSQYKVPVELFKNDDKPNCPFKICKPCRDFKQKERKDHKELAEKDGKFVCGNCHHPFPQEERALNLDGTPSTLCKPCKGVKKVYDKEAYEKWKKMYRNIQFEKMLEHETCCEVCNCIFLIPAEGTNYHRELPITIINGENIVIYDNKRYLVRDFLREFQHLIEFRIIDYDHLPENEQRDRHIISDNEEFIQKTCNISSLSTEKEIREESRGCQIACCKCHLIVTISREGDVNPQSTQVIQKQNFVNAIKREIGGCTTCGFYDENLLRFLEFNHINPEDKIEGISRMVYDSRYSIDDIKNEIIKTVLTCRSCHRIYTDWQIQQGILIPNKERY